MLRLVNSFAMSMVESLSVLSLCIFKTVRLLNRSWFIFERSHVFSLWAVEKDLSPAALIAGFTRISLHNVITSLIISRSGLGSSLIFAMMSSNQKFGRQTDRHVCLFGVLYNKYIRNNKNTRYAAPVSQTPYPIHDENLRFSLAYL